MGHFNAQNRFSYRGSNRMNGGRSRLAGSLHRPIGGCRGSRLHTKFQ
ncbi:hypothetical protein SAMN05444156_2468 [Verrucomicrobium sp. GAS474]|nr:hypothetical protein SAMN05444156_2468 [Verrucomicrobium sp. GAS474]